MNISAKFRQNWSL